MNKKLERIFSEMPVVAIIRGVEPREAVAIGEAIAEAGVKIIEVPLNSPKPFDSIERLASALGSECMIGCGTLLTKKDAKRVAEAGGQIAVTPNTNSRVIKRCIKLGLTPMPGWATPSEAFSAYKSGARYLKLFPAATYGPNHISALRAVLPNDVKLLAVGGVGAANAQPWLAAGIDGFGIGSEIFKPGMTPADVAANTAKVVATIKQVSS